MEIDYYKLLDACLVHILKQQEYNEDVDTPNPHLVDDYYDALKIPGNIETQLYTKLQEDNYVRKQGVNYRLTIDGHMFIQDGMYKRKRRRESISTNLQLASTWVISLGTALAGFYSLYQFWVLWKCH